jgi:ethanolamine utilization cobalamin adenosyltransferase
LYLNKLRTLIREVEITAVDAFVSELEIQKIDLLRALNRLSSAIYIMMLKEEKGEYGN